ncbi:MAG: 2Fe-2S iron-sulfur cluster binding domain-containing protein [Nitrospina sp.]|nr:2Fe-2S iron-sulfur cluster binding domain-containing protein [Nitrospina sp.]MBT3416253.1 2Fe-2S iron-sulfur cluster binding domain-containing protein [Nitrospina sp.]MBT3856803.1 2Fe-2S iron-sulfur cluster binding domain-containing protein [Nitrospina sp.]MBT4103868.1 2Fe-2S iron-sulfur cluster binding domain-containing protein [Nitrospina sp.]MBT4388359.1 2Fe-2S iron-sulfur cluster binding domain-containing protein [Nitrospina sp.]
MLNIIFSFVALVFLLGLVAYVLVLMANNSRILAITQEKVDLESELLKVKIKNIMARREVEAKQVKLAWNGFRKFKIISKVKETDDITSFYLSPHDGRELPGFLPGQFLTFQIPVPNQAQPVIRCYSLSDSPFHSDRYRVSIKRVPAPRDNPSAPPGLISTHFHDVLNENDIVDVKAPSGHFSMSMTKSSPVVLLAGGVGITPLLSMLNAITEMASQREVWFFLGVRNKKEHVMKEHLEMVARENENVRLNVFYSAPAETDVLSEDYHVKGRVNVENIKVILPSSNFDFYICAPPPMVKDLRKDLADWGVPKKNIHFEAFGPATVKGCKADTGKGDSAKIDIQFEKSGKTLTWDSKAASLLDFAEANGVPIDSGCRAGNCGTCLTAIKSGKVELVGEPGSKPEEGSCLACISVPKENLTLDA